MIYLLLSTNQSWAQFFVGTSGGIGRNYLTNNLSNRAFANNVSKMGLIVSAQVQYRFNGWLRAESGVDYAAKNYAIQRSGFFTGINTEVRNTFLQLPLSVRIAFPAEGRLNGFLNIGVFGAYWSNGLIKATQPNILAPKEFDPSMIYDSFYQLASKQTMSSSYSFNKDVDQRFEYGSFGAIGLGYEVKDGYEVFTRMGLYRSFSDLQKSYQENLYPKRNTTYDLVVGLLYKLDK